MRTPLEHLLELDIVFTELLHAAILFLNSGVFLPHSSKARGRAGGAEEEGDLLV